VYQYVVQGTQRTLAELRSVHDFGPELDAAINAILEGEPA
jgi:hypothetical protein